MNPGEEATVDRELISLALPRAQVEAIVNDDTRFIIDDLPDHGAKAANKHGILSHDIIHFIVACVPTSA